MTSSELPAGRDLDALIAEKVMHLFAQELSHDCAHHNYGPQLHCMACDDDIVNCQIPHYSTDIAAAWEVVEKLQPELFLELTVEQQMRDGRQFVRATFIGDRWENPQAFYDVEDAASAPEAICRAALKAVEAPKEI